VTNGVSTDTPCNLVCRAIQRANWAYEVVCDDGDIEQFNVVVGVGEEFGFEMLRDLADFGERLGTWLVHTDSTAGALFEALRDGRLTLLTRTNPLSGLSTDYPFEELLSGCPPLIDICERPRLHLNIEESIRPVGVVRRSGPAAIKHLSCHSEHWEARTVAGLRPARLLAQVLEDDWHLYENRFVITLVRKLQRFVQLAWKDISGRLQQASSSIDLFRIRNYTRVQQARALAYLLPDVREEDIDESWLRLADIHSQLKKLLRVTGLCRQSGLNHRLRKCADVQPPILDTNILTMDRRYRRARELWDLIRASSAEPQSGTDGVIPDSVTTAFVDFCQVLTLTALDVSGFTPLRSDTALVNSVNSGLELRGDYRRGDWVITLRLEYAGPMVPWLRIRWTRSIDTEVAFPHPWRPALRKVSDRYEVGPQSIVFYDRLTSAELQEIKALPLGTDKRYYRQQWASFVEDSSRQAKSAYTAEIGLLPVFSKVQPSSRHLDVITSELLDEVSRFGDSEKLRSAYVLMPVEFSAGDEGAAAPDHVVRRLLNFGDRYVPDEAVRWGGYRAGIIPVARDQFASLSRIAQLLNYQTTRFSLEHGFPVNGCPLCGTSDFGQNDGAYTCYADTCKAVWLFAACSHCHQRYPLVKRPSEPTIRATVSSPTFLERMLGGEEIPDPRSGAAPQPYFCNNTGLESSPVVCPHCGVCSEGLKCSRSCLYHQTHTANGVPDRSYPSQPTVGYVPVPADTTTSIQYSRGTE
jgi:hypothetical protein